MRPSRKLFPISQKIKGDQVSDRDYLEGFPVPDTIQTLVIYIQYKSDKIDER